MQMRMICGPLKEAVDDGDVDDDEPAWDPIQCKYLTRSRDDPVLISVAYCLCTLPKMLSKYYHSADG